MSGSTAAEWVPRDYMERAVGDLVRDPHHGLFMDPGMGKTAIVLEAVRRLREVCDVERVLVIAPLRVCYSVWPAEIEKWSQFRDLRVVNLHEHGPWSGAHDQGDLFLCNPEHLPALFGQRDPDNPRRWIPGYWRDWKRRPELLIVDESSRFKRTSGVRFKTLRRYLGDFARRQILTGSPAPNGLEDLHGQLTILDGGRTLEEGAILDPRISYYRKRYFVPVPTGRHPHDVDWKLRPGSDEDILAAIAPRITCLRAEDWLDMPEKIVTDIPILLPDQVRGMYENMLREAVVEIDTGEVILAAEEAAVGKCRQIVNGFIYNEHHVPFLIHEQKLNALDDLLAEIGPHPTLIVYEFRADLHYIQGRLGDVPHIGAGVSAKAGDAIARQWNAGELPRLLVQPQSAGHGLNLQGGGSRIVWYGPPWDLELYDQTNARLWRQGQEADRVMIYHLVGRRTVEERVARVLRQKARTQADLVAALAEETTP